MAEEFKVGDHVTWNSEAGYVSYMIVKVHIRDVDYKGHTRHASKGDPQYGIKSTTTDHIAMHKGAALKRAIKTDHVRSNTNEQEHCRGQCPVEASI